MSLPPTTRRGYSLMRIFDPPPPPCRRDFVRENKLNVRGTDLKKNCRNAIDSNKKTDADGKGSALPQRSSAGGSAKLSASLHRLNSPPKESGPVVMNMTTRKVTQLSKPLECKPSIITIHGSKKGKDVKMPLAGSKGGTKSPNNVSSSKNPTNPTIAPKKTGLTKTRSMDKCIQTEDIKDEQFLYQALNKCASSDKFSVNNQIIGREPKGSADANASDSASVHNMDKAPGDAQGAADNMNLNLHDLHLADPSNLNTERSEFTNGCKEGEASPTKSVGTMPDEPHCVTDQSAPYSNNNNSNLKKAGSQQSLVTSKAPIMSGEQAKPCDSQVKAYDMSSGEEHQDQASIQHSNKMELVRTLGSRYDIRLPRYLEREKRVKEERDRQPPPDPHCPPGHYLLSDEERQAEFELAKKHETELLKRLNSLSITSNTLRVRTAKVQLENELTDIEALIKKLSKPKVYRRFVESQ